jgi:hypothetical protein
MMEIDNKSWGFGDVMIGGLILLPIVMEIALYLGYFG